MKKQILTALILALPFSSFAATNIIQKSTVEAQKIVKTNSKLFNKSITHTVGNSETLSSIGKKYKVSASDIKRWNNLKVDNIKKGQKLKVIQSTDFGEQYYDYAPANKAGYDSRKFTFYYVVKSGDTIQSIAKKYKTTTEITKVNNLQQKGGIRTGMDLKITTYQNNADDKLYYAYTKSKLNQPSSTFIHKVQKGETLESLAKKYNKTAEFIKVNNKLSSNTLKPGELMTIIKNFKNMDLSRV